MRRIRVSLATAFHHPPSSFTLPCETLPLFSHFYMLLSPLEPLSEFVFDRVRFAPLSQSARCALRMYCCLCTVACGWRRRVTLFCKKKRCDCVAGVAGGSRGIEDQEGLERLCGVYIYGCRACSCSGNRFVAFCLRYCGQAFLLKQKWATKGKDG